MKEKLNRVLVVVLILAAVVTSIALVPNLGKDNHEVNNSETNNNNQTTTKTYLKCYDFIDGMMKADGLTHLEGGLWGRGIHNLFLVDLIKQEIYLASDMTAPELSDLWYKYSFNDTVSYSYSYQANTLTNMTLKRLAPNLDESKYTQLLSSDPATSAFYELKVWMEYYVSQAEKYGCSLNGLTQDKLLDTFTKKNSKAESTDVVSWFDQKSEDGVIRYFSDVHSKWKIEDNPRYKELSTVADFLALDDKVNNEAFFFINAVYHDYSKKAYAWPANHIQGNALTEFVKDVIFTQTTWIEDVPGAPTIGAYFIYVDNPNGQFKSMYLEPSYKSGVSTYNPVTDFGTDIRKVKFPYDAVTMFAVKDELNNYTVHSTSPGSVYDTMRVYLSAINEFFPNVKFSDDFVRNYTRPFDANWQSYMGLTDFYKTKFGLLIEDIQYK